MKKFIVAGSKDCFICHNIEYTNLYSLIDYIIENPFDFVSTKLFESHQVYISEFINGEYYNVAVLNPITGEVSTINS